MRFQPKFDELAHPVSQGNWTRWHNNEKAGHGGLSIRNWLE